MNDCRDRRPPRAGARKPRVPGIGLGGSCLVVASWLIGAGRAPAAEPADAPQLPPLVRSKDHALTIPFQVPEQRGKKGETAVRRVMLQVSRDLGGTWESAGEAAPEAGGVGFRAVADGEYWFRLRGVDGQGRLLGGPGPDMRVLVDAAGPRLSARVWRGVDGEIVCRFAAADDSINLASLKVEYRAAGDPGWKTVAAEGILARQTPAHLVGEEIWWAGEQVESLTVRLAVADAAGNRTVRQFTLEKTDPLVDQAALAAEIGVPPLPEPPAGGIADRSLAATGSPVANGALPPRVGRPAGSAGAWEAETAAVWSGGESRAGSPREPLAAAAREGADERARLPSVLVARTVDEASVPADRTAAPAGADGPRPAANPAGGVAGDGLEYRGRPLRLSRSRRFTWDFEVPADASSAPGGGSQAVLWATRDGGTTWEPAASAEAARGSLDVQLPAAGLYGFRLELAVDPGSTGPRAGDSPETWVGIDEEPPQVELTGTERLEGDGDALVIRYRAQDILLTPRSTRILFSPHGSGPWATITSGADNEGAYTWKPDRGAPARVYIRIEVSDAAGNIGTATSPEPVAVAPSRFTGRLGELKPLPVANP